MSAAGLGAEGPGAEGVSARGANAASEQPLVTPGRSQGLLDVLRWRFLLRLLVRKELRVRYRGSVLGLLWSYVKPAFQLFVFYIAMGKFLRLGETQPNYLIYLFSGIVIVNFFSEVFGNATRSIVANADLVKKIYLPRELFPVANVWVAVVHLLPQIVVLALAALATGWRPGPVDLLAGLAALVLTMVTGLGLGLVFGAANVLFRDSENFVDLILMAATWMSPVLYSWEMVQHVLPHWLFVIYQLNPITAAVQLSHVGFWAPSATVRARYGSAADVVPPSFLLYLLAAAAISAGLVLLGQLVFRRLEGRFAQEL